MRFKDIPGYIILIALAVVALVLTAIVKYNSIWDGVGTATMSGPEGGPCGRVVVNLPENVMDLYTAADQGDAEAARTIGKAYQEAAAGNGCASSQLYGSAFDYYNLAVLFGGTDADVVARQLASLHLPPEKAASAPQNLADYAKQVQKYAMEGLAQSQNTLGVLYLKGLGVEQSDTEAAKWFQVAATAAGYKRAENNLAMLYADGKGVPQDYVLAYYWLRLAEKTGLKISQSLLDRCKSHLTKEQIAAQDLLVKEKKVRCPQCQP